MTASLDTHLSDDQWLTYVRDGYLRLGHVLSDSELGELQSRIDAIMLGEADIDYDKMLMQLDSDTGEYGDMKKMSRGHKGARLDYRKIEQLEIDPLFLSFIQRTVFREICARTYGAHVPVSVFRSMFMNKPAGKGTKLPWHQDRWTHLDRDPLITIYTALDPATKDNGCIQVIPRTHRFGIANTEHGSGFLTPEMTQAMCPEDQRVFVEMEPGETVLLHNWLMHGSDKNHCDQSRRALSVCYMDGRTAANNGKTFPVVFGEEAITAA